MRRDIYDFYQMYTYTILFSNCRYLYRFCLLSVPLTAQSNFNIGSLSLWQERFQELLPKCSLFVGYLIRFGQMLKTNDGRQKLQENLNQVWDALRSHDCDWSKCERLRNSSQYYLLAAREVRNLKLISLTYKDL